MKKELKDIETIDLVEELIERDAVSIIISLPPYHTAEVHLQGPVTALQLHGDWSDKL